MARKQGSPGFERRAALCKKVMRVVHGLNTGQLVVEAALRHLAANAQRGQMCAHGAPQVVNRKCVQTVVDGGKGRVQGVGPSACRAPWAILLKSLICCSWTRHRRLKVCCS